MPKFEIRYLADAPQGSDDPITVEAAMFSTVGDFTDFFSHQASQLSGGFSPSGSVVFRVRNDIVADIRRLPDSQ